MTNVDLDPCHHMASLGLNELTPWPLSKSVISHLMD